MLASGGFTVAAALAFSTRVPGVASVDITPDYNVRLNGFGHRKSESEGVTAKIYAKALAFRDEACTFGQLEARAGRCSRKAASISPNSIRNPRSLT